MAPNWLRNLQKLISKEPDSTDGVTSESSVGHNSELEEKIDSKQSTDATLVGFWENLALNLLAPAMFFIGAGITACSELLGMWAMLGYIMLTGSPMVYLLRRIDLKLERWIQISDKKRE